MSEDVNTQGTRTTKRAIVEAEKRRKAANKKLKKLGLPEVSRSKAIEIAVLRTGADDIVKNIVEA